jgi:hypothetical protein
MAPLWLLGVLPEPDPLPQPAPTTLLWLLLLLTFFLHLVPMNLALGGSIIALVARVRGRDGSRPQHRACAAWFAGALPTLMAAAVSSGVAALLFLQVLHGRAFFASAILMAWPWISVVPLLILAYYGAYRLAFTSHTTKRRAWLAAFVTAVFAVVAFVYASNMSMMLRADRFAEWTAAGTGGWHLNAGDPTLLPRYLHLVLGAVAVAGGGLAISGLPRRRHDPGFALWAMRHGSGWAAATTLINLTVGFWWLLALPRDVLMRFMGRDPAAATWLMVGIVLGMTALGAFAFAWRAVDPAPAVRVGAGALAVTLIAMLVSRDQVRESAFVLMGLGPVSWVEPQWGPALIFTALLVCAAAVITWMVGLLLPGGDAGRT